MQTGFKKAGKSGAPKRQTRIKMVIPVRRKGKICPFFQNKLFHCQKLSLYLILLPKYAILALIASLTILSLVGGREHSRTMWCAACPGEAGSPENGLVCRENGGVL